MNRTVLLLRRIFVLLLSCFVVLSSTVGIAAEDGTGDDEVIKAWGIGSDEREISLRQNETRQLSYFLEPENATEVPQWTIDYDSNHCIELEGDGVITATENYGYAYVYARTEDGYSVRYTIYVCEEPVSIEFSKTSYMIAEGGSEWINIYSEPYESTHCRKHAESSNPEIASVEEEWVFGNSFRVNGISEGSATITVTADNNVSVSVEVTVKKGIASSIYSDDSTTVYMHTGDTRQLTYKLRPSDAEEKPVWSVESYGSQGVSVDENGVVTALKAGTAYVRAKIQSGSSLSYTVNVAERASRIEFTKDELVLLKDCAYNLRDYLQFYPDDAKYCFLECSSEDYTIARTESSYSTYVYAHNPGTTYVSVKDDYGLSAKVKVTVIEGYAESISAVQTTHYLPLNGKVKLDYSLYSRSGNLENEKVTFTVTEGQNVVSVDEEGNVSANSYGKAVVQARTALYGTDVISSYSSSQSYTIYVASDPGELMFGQSEYDLSKNTSGVFYAYTDSPESELCKKTYSSSDSSIISVSSDGFFNTLQEGTATVICTAENGVKAEATVHVTAETVRYFGIADPAVFVHLNPGEEKDIKDLLDHPAEDFASMRWESSDETIAEVSDGTVRGISPGFVYIYLIENSSGYRKGTYPVFVNKPLTSFEFKDNEYTIASGEQLILREYLKFEPANEMFEDVKITSSDESVVSILNEFSWWAAEGKANGTAVITAEKSTGERAEMTVHVSDKQPGQSIVLKEQEPITVHKDYMRSIDLKIEPASADQRAYTLISSNPDIVSIEKQREDGAGNGRISVRGIKPGKATVTAVLNDNKEKSVSFEVTVVDGDPDRSQYNYHVSLSEITPDYGRISMLGDHDEYTCYVGKSYFLETHGYWTRSDVMEVPVKALQPIDNFKAENNCIVKIYAGFGWAYYPSAFNTSYSGIPFACAHEGTAVIPVTGNRTVTIHVVNPPEDELEILADEIANAEDPTEAAVFEGNAEEVKEKIEVVKNNGETLTVKLEEEKLETVNEEEQTLVVEAVNADEETSIDYYDVNLLLKTSETEEEIAKIVETNAPITVILPLSEDAKTKGDTYKVIRIHNGIAEELESKLSEDGNYIVFKTNRFSTYAVVYQQKKTEIAIYGSSLSLEGKVGINFYLDIDETSAKDLTIHMTMNNKESVIAGDKGTAREIDGHTYMMYEYPVAAKEMRDIVTLTVVDDKGNNVKLTKDGTDYTEGYPYSASEYFARVEEVGQEKTKKLSRVLNNYGKYAQIYFDYKVTDEVKDTVSVADVTAETLESYKAVMTEETVDGLTYAGGSTMLDDAIGFRIYFKVGSGYDIKKYTFTIDNKAVTPEKSGSMYFVELADIAAKDLGVMHTIKATDGTKTFGIQYSALSYARRVLELTGEDRVPLQNMCRAMYLYNQQAIEYFGN